jgi:hypothetical protein
VTVAIAALIFGVSTGEEHGFGSLASMAGLVGCVVFAVAFVVIERTVASPMVRLAFLAVPVRRITMLAMFVAGGTLAAYAYFIALYMQGVLGFSEVHAAVALLPGPVVLLLTSTLITRRLIARFGLKATLLAGLSGLAAGELFLSQISAGDAYLTGVLPGQILTATGAALIFPVVSVGMTSHVAPGDRGLAGGLVPTVQQIRSGDRPRTTGDACRWHRAPRRLVGLRLPNGLPRRGWRRGADDADRRLQRDAAERGRRPRRSS